MQPALRLTQAPDLKLHPEDLIQTLEKSFMNFHDLVHELDCSLDDLEETLNAPETSQMMKLKTNLACLQVQLIALRAAPHCTARLVALTNEKEKPEVARRAITTLIQIAGIPTGTSSQDPVAPPVPTNILPKPLEFSEEEHKQKLSAVVFALRLEKDFNLDLSQIPKTNMDPIAQALRPFIPQQQNKDNTNTPQTD